MPGQPGVSFAQVDYVWSDLVVSNSNVGKIFVDPAPLLASTGRTSGYINVSTGNGWVVQNLPVLAGFPYQTISIDFQLANTSGQLVTSLPAYVELSDDPEITFSHTPIYTWQVGKDAFSADGADPGLPGTIVVSPPPPIVVIAPPGPGGGFQLIQSGHQNVQAANEQCWPCAVANSLQWLKDTYHVNIPDDDVLGIGITGGAVVPPNSLPGQLDHYMQRHAGPDRTNGAPTGNLEALVGKLNYFAANGLGGMEVKHQSVYVGPLSQDVTTNGITSHFNAMPTFEFILGEVISGADVEIGYGPLSGIGHAVNVVAAGYDAQGEPYVMFVSDHRQAKGDPLDDSLGTLQVDYSRVDGPDAQGYYRLTDVADHRGPGNPPPPPIILNVFSELPGPSMFTSKWGQLPGCRLYLNNTNAFGSDRASDCNWSNAVGHAVVADDFRSDGRPIAAVRWWGSYLNGHGPGDEDGFKLSFFQDLRPANTFSRPTNLLASYIAPWNKLTVTTNAGALGLDGKAIYEYTANLRDTCLWVLTTNGVNVATPWSFLESSNTVYWLAIEAERGQSFVLGTNGVWTNFPSGRPNLAESFWGWHTSPCSNLDASVTGAATNLANWASNSVAYGELDQAFDLLTYAAAPPVNVANLTRLQRPNLTCSGVAVLVNDGTGSPIVADDFRGQSNSRISDIHIWGAWQNGQYDTNASFRLRIYSDVPATNNVPSHPGNLLWERTLVPPALIEYVGDTRCWYKSVVASGLCESFWDPSQGPGMGAASRDSKVYQYDFYTDPTNAFFQTNGQTYWLSVTVKGATDRFGWKTAVTNDHYLDAAAFGTQTNPPFWGWTSLYYPTNQPFSPQPMDMAFALAMNGVEVFGCSTGTVVIAGLSPQPVKLTGSSMWVVGVGPEGETTASDTNGLDLVGTELVSLNLQGTCSAGPLTLRTRDPDKAPYLRSLGQIKEVSNSVSNRLDVPPFGPGAADSFFDVYLEVAVGSSLLLHNETPITVSGAVSSLPPQIGEHHDFAGSVSLVDESGATTSYSLRSLSYTPVTPPPPEITGITILPSGQLQITWANGGELRSSTTVTGAFTTVVAMSSPYVGPITGSMQFYRVYRP